MHPLPPLRAVATPAINIKAKVKPNFFSTVNPHGGNTGRNLAEDLAGPLRAFRNRKLANT
jgi:hypothetical protein